jgi:hypothetical protein
MAEAVLSGFGGRADWSATRTLARTAAIVLAALALSWAAVLNGQPFVHPDTVGYTRGPDVAVMKLFGPRFGTVWGKTNEKQIARPALAPAPGAAASADDNEVMGGRSIYYGFLAYLGALTGGFWLTVFAQSLGVAVLVEIALRGLRILGLSTYAGVMALLTLATSAPFFAAFVMPDIWAGVAIGALASLFALSRRLTRVDMALLAAMAAFGALAHNSVVPVLAVMTLAGGGLWLLKRGDAPDPRAGLAAGAAAVVIALAGGLAFSAMVRHAVGAPPVNPPFLTARVIADGPGERYVRDRCAARPFAVCKYAARLPLDVDHFLWGVTPKDGVFETVAAPERRALADQDASFALAAVRAYPNQQAAASARNAALQMVDTDLSDFNYKPSLRAGFASTVPAGPYAAMQNTLAFREAWPLQALWGVQSGVALASLAMLGWMALRAQKAGSAHVEPSDAMILALLILVGVLANGAVCGVLSTLYGRYQARVTWLIPLAATLLALVRARARGASVRLA